MNWKIEARASGVAQRDRADDIGKGLRANQCPEPLVARTGGQSKPPDEQIDWNVAEALPMWRKVNRRRQPPSAGGGTPEPETAWLAGNHFGPLDQLEIA